MDHMMLLQDDLVVLVVVYHLIHLLCRVKFYYLIIVEREDVSDLWFG